MTALLRNADAQHTLVVRVWHRSNAFMSDGDAPWLDDDGAPTSARSRDHAVPPGETLSLALRQELALTLLPAASSEPTGIVDSVRRYLRTGSTDSGCAADGVPFSLANGGNLPLRVRVFASATFQFSPLQELLLAPGEIVRLSTREEGISVRVG
jgi:hypothetical protein